MRHPSMLGDNNDVLLGQLYDLQVEIENVSNRPALYPSLTLFIGGGAVLVDEDGNEIPSSSQVATFPNIEPGPRLSVCSASNRCSRAISSPVRQLLLRTSY